MAGCVQRLKAARFLETGSHCPPGCGYRQVYQVNRIFCLQVLFRLLGSNASPLRMFDNSFVFPRFLKPFLKTLAIALVLSMAGCASVTTDTLVVRSDPAHAEVLLSKANAPFTDAEIEANLPKAKAKALLEEGSKFFGPIEATTPAVFTLQRKGDFRVRIERSGYRPVEVRVTHQVSDAGGLGVAGNVLVGGLVGLAIDAGTGAAHDLMPNPLDIKLEPLPE